MSKFLHDADNDAKAIAVLRVFSENSKATYNDDDDNDYNINYNNNR